MRILGVNDGHNAAVALLEDGEIKLAVQEERFRRVKNFIGFPTRSLEYVLQATGLRIDDIDRFAIAGAQGRGFASVADPRQATLDFYHSITDPQAIETVRRARRRQRIKATLIPRPLAHVAKQMLQRPDPPRRPRLGYAAAAGLPLEKSVLIDHHTAHASSAYRGWGQLAGEVLVLTCDGEGDGICATVNRGCNGRLERLCAIDAGASIGNLYAMTTFVLGMVPLEHEYKLMGMAPYADPKRVAAVAEKLRTFFEIDPAQPLAWRLRPGMPATLRSYATLRRLLEHERFDSICGGIQRVTEELVLAWVRRCIAITGLSRVALSGGVFMNVKLNKAIMDLPEVEDLFVFPSCGDETNAFGAAWEAHAQIAGPQEIAPLRTFYLGPSFTDEEARAAIEQHRFSQPVRWRRCDHIEQEVGELLASGKIVARFAGREEFGARALGNRSILADPSDLGVVKTINSMIKCRDFWMPFATAMTERQAETCLVNPKKIASPYMILAFDTTDKVEQIRAGVHPYDHTVRPQVVTPEANPRFHALIEAFERASGKTAGILNTSFNLHGLPLVSAPTDALEVFDKSGLEYLAIENYLVSKDVVAQPRLTEQTSVSATPAS